MDKTLVMIEVSRKQNYIFSSKKLKDNVRRSAIISYVTGSDFFLSVAETQFCKEKNLVYSGGGHAVLQFDDAETAKRFAEQVTEAVLRKFDGLELFVKQLPLESAGTTPKDKLTCLTQEMERKKSIRQAAFCRLSFGVEALDENTLLPVLDNVDQQSASFGGVSEIEAPEGWSYPAEFSELADEDNFIAVIHADGNAMGSRMQNIYEQKSGQAWDSCCEMLHKFSDSIDKDFKSAYLKTAQTIADYLKGQPQNDTKPNAGRTRTLPMRPIILAGDDVCFVTAGNIALESARIFLETLSQKQNEADGQPYSACAGVAIVHTKYPFHKAYDLSEELCGNAKRFGVSVNPNGSVSAMDWHIEFGQLKDGLSELRQDYQTQDGNRLELRPVTVIVPQPEDAASQEMEQIVRLRSYAFFRNMCRSMQNGRKEIACGKLKELCTALKQGEVESRFFIHDHEIKQLLSYSLSAAYSAGELLDKWRSGNQAQALAVALDAFCTLENPGRDGKNSSADTEKRCLFFDAIEILDHFICIEEVKE